MLKMGNSGAHSASYSSSYYRGEVKKIQRQLGIDLNFLIEKVPGKIGCVGCAGFFAIRSWERPRMLMD